MKYCLYVLVLLLVFPKTSFGQNLNLNYVHNWLKTEAKVSTKKISLVRKYFVDHEYFHLKDSVKLNQRLTQISHDDVNFIMYSPNNFCGLSSGKGEIRIVTINKQEIEVIQYNLDLAKKEFESDAKKTVLIIDGIKQELELLNELNSKEIYCITYFSERTKLSNFGVKSKDGIIKIWTKEKFKNKDRR
jgi:hypothetical protein